MDLKLANVGFFTALADANIEVFVSNSIRIRLIVKCSKGQSMKMWQCLVCGFVYEEEKGWPEDGIAPGTRWEDVPADWTCPECGVTKAEFEMVEF